MAKLGHKMGLVEHFGGNLEELEANLEPTWGNDPLRLANYGASRGHGEISPYKGG